MGDLLLPPWLRISATEPAFVSNTHGGQSIFSGAARTTESAGDKVGVRISTQNASDRGSDPNRAFLESHLGARRGQGGRIWYTPATAGYVIRGSFSAPELLTNNTFASGTTGWTQGSAYSLSVADRVMRCRRTQVTATGIALAASSAAAVTQYAPYVLRAMLMQGRGTFATGFDLAFGSTAGTNDYADSTNSASYGMQTLTAVAPASTIFSSVRDQTSSGLIAGDFIDIPYISLSRCALVDNAPNLLLQSDELDTTWSATRASVDDQATTAPDGTTTADEIVEDATASNTHFIAQAVTVSSVAADFSFGVALKPNSRTWARLQLLENTGSTVIDAYFNLATGAVGTMSSGSNWANQRAFAVPLGDGWYACYLVGRKTNAATSITARIKLATGDGVESYTGDGTSNIRAWRATLAQSSVPTRLVQTTTTALASGTLQTGLGLHLKGLPASVNGLLRYGAWVQSGRQLCKVIARLDSDAAGLGYLQLAYPPRTPPPDNDPLIVHEPFGRFVATENRVGWQERPGVFADFELDLIEALDS